MKKLERVGRVLGLCALCMLLAPAAMAYSILTEPDEVIVLTTPVQVVAGGGWTASGDGSGFRIESAYEFLASNRVGYEYTITTNTANPDLEPPYDLLAPALSHFIIQVSDDFDLDLNFDEGSILIRASSGDPVYEFGPFPQGNADLAWPPEVSFQGIKFDNLGNGVYSIYFESTRIPMLGDFYGKGGKDSYAYNSGFGFAEGDRTIANSIFVPNHSDFTIIEVPEPATLSLLGLGLGAAGLRTWRKRRRA